MEASEKCIVKCVSANWDLRCRMRCDEISTSSEGERVKRKREGRDFDDKYSLRQTYILRRNERLGPRPV